MKFEDFAEMFGSKAKEAIRSKLPDVSSVIAPVTQKVEEVQERIEAGVQEAKQAAVAYGAITVALQFVTAISAAILAYTAMSGHRMAVRKEKALNRARRRGRR